MNTNNTFNRRRFLQTASASAAGMMIVSPQTAFGAAANSKLRLGIIGCGGRGIWIGRLFEEFTNTKVVAVADYFRDRVDMAGEQLDIAPDRRYVGLDGYKELLAGDDVDAVAVESPPYFHPIHTVAALEAGKHVFLAKPIAVDVPGCKAIMAAAKKAEGTLTTLVDFQTRNNELFREAAQRIRDGAIGEPTLGQVFYYASRLSIRTEPGTEVARLRNWMFDIALSGDIIVEQNIHVLDVANWFIDAHPISARGTGGRKVRVDVGDCWDHFVVTYKYPNDTLVDFSSAQFTTGFDDLCTRICGSLGTVDAHYGGIVQIHSKDQGTWIGGETKGIYQDGAVNNMKDFCAGIAAGQFTNNADESARSTMTSILGRQAAYEQREVTWDEMVAANVALDPHLDLPENGPETTV
ncbi:MAG: Gfo/Idh/MocA family oxidoreductase [Candidatus Hydrogenedentes bacterium]|nr:Gfo/Idh/MocA family oxidoreductase [Candidatus Hydrogenedentota bacterium]